MGYTDICYLNMDIRKNKE